MSVEHILIEDEAGFSLMRPRGEGQEIVYRTYIQSCENHWIISGSSYPAITEGKNARIFGVLPSKEEALKKAYSHIKRESKDYHLVDKTGRAEEGQLARQVANPLVETPLQEDWGPYGPHPFKKY